MGEAFTPKPRLTGPALTANMLWREIHCQSHLTNVGVLHMNRINQPLYVKKAQKGPFMENKHPFMENILTQLQNFGSCGFVQKGLSYMDFLRYIGHALIQKGRQSSQGQGVRHIGPMAPPSISLRPPPG